MIQSTSSESDLSRVACCGEDIELVVGNIEGHIDWIAHLGQSYPLSASMDTECIYFTYLLRNKYALETVPVYIDFCGIRHSPLWHTVHASNM